MTTIAEICFSKSWGGLEQRCGEDAKWLSESGHNVISIINPSTPLHEFFQKINFNTCSINTRDYFDPIATLKLTSVLTQYKVQAIHIHRTQDMGVVLTAADFAKVPRRVLTLRMESRRRKKDPYHRWAYSRLTSVLTTTERMRDLVIDNVAVSPDKVQVLYNGYDVDKLRSEAESTASIREKWGIPEDAFVVGITGRLESGKGQHLLISAAQKLIVKIPELYIMIVGDETVNLRGELARLKIMATEIGFLDRVIFTGFQHPPGIIVPAFDISLLATNKETFGGVIVEAMALGVPVIGTNAGGVPEIIEHGVTGLLIKPESPVDLATAIRTLYDNPKMRLRFSEAGVEKVRSKFSRNSHIAGLQKALI